MHQAIIKPNLNDLYLRCRLGYFLVLLLFSSLTVSCETNPHTESQSAPNTHSQGVKNVIMIIGDGMGPQQLGLLLAYAQQAPNSVLKGQDTAFDRLMDSGVMGLSMTYSHNVLVTDSAAAGTQLATGKTAEVGIIGADYEGNRVDTMLEIARDLGKSTGLVSDTRITHATPAAFGAHVPHRSQENEIAEQLLDTNPEIMLSGGLRHFIPRDLDEQLKRELMEITKSSVQLKSKRKDNNNLLEIAQSKGYTLVFNKEQMDEADGKILGLFSSSSMPNALKESRERKELKRSFPTLDEMAAKAINELSKNEKGFFLMIEAGQIDWMGHSNDAGCMLHEMLRLNTTINYVLNWAESRDDTLVIVTADHETGGFSFSYSAYEIPEGRPLSGDLFNGDMVQPKFNFGNPEVLDKLYAQRLCYSEIFSKFNNGSEKTPTELMILVNQNTEFDIDIDQAMRILETHNNPYQTKDHSTLNSPVVPRMGDNEAFFVYHKRNTSNLLARAVANQQNIVWSNGTHSNTPVPVFAYGPEDSIKPFQNILHLTEVGQLTIEAIKGEN